MPISGRGQIFLAPERMPMRLLSMRTFALMVVLLAGSSALEAGEVFWNFTDVPDSGIDTSQGWAPEGWVQGARDGGFWTFPRPFGSVPGVESFLSDGALTFIRTAESGLDEIEATIFTPAFRFANLATSLLQILEIDFSGPGAFDTDQIELTLHVADDTTPNSPEVGTIIALSPASGFPAPLSGSESISSLGLPVDENTYYRIRIRASDKDNNYQIPQALIGGLKITSAALDPTGTPDYDGNSTVDGADFLLWQREMGRQGTLSADGNLDGVVNAKDLAIWRDNYGWLIKTASPAGQSVPEPATMTGALLGLIALYRRKRRREI